MSSLYSKIKSNYEKQLIALMIPNEDEESWHYLSVKKHHHY